MGLERRRGWELQSGGTKNQEQMQAGRSRHRRRRRHEEGNLPVPTPPPGDPMHVRSLSGARGTHPRIGSACRTKGSKCGADAQEGLAVAAGSHVGPRRPNDGARCGTLSISHAPLLIYHSSSAASSPPTVHRGTRLRRAGQPRASAQQPSVSCGSKSTSSCA